MTGNGVFMMIYEIKVGSVTNAQRGAKLLKNAGYRVFVHKQLRHSQDQNPGKQDHLQMVSLSFLSAPYAVPYLVMIVKSGKGQEMHPAAAIV